MVNTFELFWEQTIKSSMRRCEGGHQKLTSAAFCVAVLNFQFNSIHFNLFFFLLEQRMRWCNLLNTPSLSPAMSGVRDLLLHWVVDGVEIVEESSAWSWEPTQTPRPFKLPTAAAWGHHCRPPCDWLLPALWCHLETGHHPWLRPISLGVTLGGWVSVLVWCQLQRMLPCKAWHTSARIWILFSMDIAQRNCSNVRLERRSLRSQNCLWPSGDTAVRIPEPSQGTDSLPHKEKGLWLSVTAARVKQQILEKSEHNHCWFEVSYWFE